MMHESKEEKIGSIIETLSEEVPKLIRSVVDEFYSPEAAGKIGRSLAEFYKALIDGGIPEDSAIVMTHRYQKILSFRGMGHVCRPMSHWWRGYGMKHGGREQYARWRKHHSGYGSEEETEEETEE